MPNQSEDKAIKYLGWRRPDGHDDAKNLPLDDSYINTHAVDRKGKLRPLSDVRPEARKELKKRQKAEAQRAGALAALASK